MRIGVGLSIPAVAVRRKGGGVGPVPATLTLTGPLTYAVNAAAGTLVANIGNVPSGVTPTITPNDGRLVVAGSAGAWTVVTGMTASTAGTIALAVAAAGANGASASVVVTATASTVNASSLSGLNGNSNVMTGGGTDDTAVLQAWFNSADARTKTLVMDRACLVTGLTLPSNTRVTAPNNDCGLYLASGSNRAIIRNANRRRLPEARHATSAEKATFDHDISWIGGTLNGNQDGQAHNENGVSTGIGTAIYGTWVVGAQMFGVINPVVDAKIINCRTFSIHGALVYDPTFINRDLKVKLDSNGRGTSFYFDGVTPITQDGIHVNGPASGFIIECYGQSWDDLIALNADDGDGDLLQTNELGEFVGRGPIDNGTVKARPNAAYAGVRFLSKDSLMDNITVDYVGTTHGCAVIMSPYGAGGNGNFGSNIRFTQLVGGHVRNDLIKPSDQAVSFVSLSGTFAGPLTFDVLTRTDMDATATQSRTIDIKDGAILPLLYVKQLNQTDLVGSTLAPPEGSPTYINRANAVANIKIDNWTWSRPAGVVDGVAGIGVGFSAQGSNSGSGGIEIGAATISRVGNAIAWKFGSLDYLRLKNVSITNIASGGAPVYADAGATGNVTSGYITNVSPSPQVQGGGAVKVQVPVT